MDGEHGSDASSGAAEVEVASAAASAFVAGVRSYGGYSEPKQLVAQCYS
jgi:hypothetical protein